MPDRKPSNARKAGGRKHRSRGKRGASSAAGLRLFGLHPVRAALANERRIVTALYATPNGLERLGPLPAHRSSLIIKKTDTQALDRMTGPEAVHQGLVLECAPLDQLDASEIFHLADADLLLVLDQITDPHNVGAILRSAVALDAKAVLITARDTAIETPVLVKSASGAFDTISVIRVRNLSKAVEELNAMRFTTIGLDSAGEVDLEQAIAGVEPQRIALVLGAEGRGLREQTREACSMLARLDMPGAIKSLNVSNAAALSLYVARRHLASRE